MVNSEHFRIIELFSKDFNVELTINQVAKLTKKPYALTNKYVHELINYGALRQKKIGASILCTLEFSNSLTLSALVYSSMIKQTSRVVASAGLMANNPIIFEYDGAIYIVNDSDVALKGAKHVTFHEFMDILPTMRLKDISILQNAELFWRSVSAAAK